MGDLSISGLLGFLDSKKRAVKKGLLDLVQNPSASVEMLDDRAKNYNANVAPVISGGLLQNRPLTEDEINQKSIDMAMNFGPMGVGHIAYHGSPHKFDKFSLDKIGTGEGAQAYGHGVYLAESKDVAKSYANQLADVTSGNARKVLKPAPEESVAFDVENFLGEDIAGHAAGRAEKNYFKNGKNVYEFEDGSLGTLDDLGNFHSYAKPETSLYKTDIPDEAVARMLDWDKPLSQQNEFVQSIIARQHGVSLDNYRRMMKLDPDKFDKTGKELVSSYRGAQPDEVASDLFANGILGIRYLDGSSRSAGQGSFNFVAFDPEMIRILERNGQPTGLLPWAPNEYKGLLKP